MTPTASPQSTGLALRNTRIVRRTVALGAMAMVVISLLLLYFLMQATNNRDLYVSNLFILDVLFSLFLLYSSKKFE